MASVYYGRGDWERSVLSLREAVKIKPDEGPAHYDLAMALMWLGKVAEGNSHLQIAERVHPGISRIRTGKQRFMVPF